MIFGSRATDGIVTASVLFKLNKLPLTYLANASWADAILRTFGAWLIKL